MNARITPPRGAEHRRAIQLANLRAHLFALGCELKRIGTLGDDDAAEALRRVAVSLRDEADSAVGLAAQHAQIATERFEAFDASCTDAQDEHDPSKGWFDR